MKIILPIFISLLLASCSSQDVAGVATASAVLVAVPLSPAFEVYHVVNRTKAKQIKQYDDFWEKAAPFYTNKTVKIETRNPIEDSNYVRESVGLLFLPSVKGGRVYTGLHSTEYGVIEVEEQFVISNQSKIESNEFLVFILDLLTHYPDEYAPTSVAFHDSFTTYLEAKFEYLDEFNQHMYKTSNQRVDPTVKTPVKSGNEQGTAGHP